MFQWLFNRLFTSKNIGYLLEKAEPHIINTMKDNMRASIEELLQDEEFNKNLVSYLDAYYNRYAKKIGGLIGGLGKGLGAIVKPQEKTLVSQLVDGNFDVKGILGSMILQGIGSQNQQSSGVVSQGEW